MASENFVHLSVDNTSNDGSPCNSRPSEINITQDISNNKDDNIPKAESIAHSNAVDGVEHEKHSQEMELDSTVFHEQQIFQDSAETIKIDTIVEKANATERSGDVENNCSVAYSVNTLSNRAIDESPISGVKRARMAYIDQQPSVHVVYNSLTRDSRKKLKELLQQWSEWHSRHESSFSDSALENGEETYFPAIHIGQESSSTVSFWVDQSRNDENKESAAKDSDSVPLYDRGYVLGSTLVDGSNNPESVKQLEASRCFNCGSYSHSLKECSRPRDNVAITSARKHHNAKKNPTAVTRGQSRYYQSSPGKFDDLKPGVLGPETRECLGIGEFDPPPWLHRMREIGYPPGYLDVKEDEDQPSGITIFADEETKLDYEEGELPERVEAVPPEKKMTVEFPGINAPIPENADQRRWAGSSSRSSSSDSWRNRHQHSSSPLSEPHISYHQDQRRSREYRENGLHVSDNGPGSSTHGYPSRYSPYDRSPLPRSPGLGRSQSDRGYRSPLAPEGSSSHYSSMHRHSSSHHSSDRWDPQNQYDGYPDVYSQLRERERYEHRQHYRR